MNTAKITKKTKGRLCNYYRDESSNPLSSNSEPLKYKTSIAGSTYDLADCEVSYNATKVGKTDTKIVVPLTHLSNFWENFKYTID